MFILRHKHRQAASVEESWNRIERWVSVNAPEMVKTLRPGASDAEFAALEHDTEITLPADVRQTYRLHDGQEGSGFGVIAGQPFDPLTKLRSNLQLCREVCDGYENGDADCEWDLDSKSFPPDAIRQRHFNWKWLSIGDWDGNHYGVDFDPGPNGVHGQIINFGRDEELKFVLALSWAHFLEDVADELEAGNILIRRDEQGEIEGFSRRDHQDQGLFHFYGDWSKAKLPLSFQSVVPAPRTPIHPGERVVGPLAKDTWACVEGFVAEMSAYEQHWLNIRPIHELGYRLIVETPTGHRAYALSMGDGPECEAALAKLLPEPPRRSCLAAFSKSNFNFQDAKDAIIAEGRARAEELKMGVYRNDAVDGYRQIFAKHCTNRKRTCGEDFVQVFPPFYDQSRTELAEVRQVAPDDVIVYVEVRSRILRRFHLKLVEDRWRIDLLDEMVEGMGFRKKSLILGMYG